ncbi:DNA primase [Thermicanus aegyptius]|uniref:DNA primase n=1 Tax=Thermicanus aegyptius TaxID=94009 RepID=UPI0004250ADC|nr:DNA primase [Thermicanus aegyptius]
MPSIPEEIIEKVRLAHDIVDVVSQYVSLRKSGKRYMGLCPFHSEKTPSFTVVPDKQFFYCFGCHVGGDVLKFIMEIEGFSYVESIQYLAEKAGIPLPEMEMRVQSEEDLKKERMREAHLLATKYYHHVLNYTRTGETAREYLKGRGLDFNTIRTFQIGYAPGKDYLTRFLTKKGFDPDEMVEAGLLIKSEKGNLYRDRFADRILFPIEDLKGQVVGFSGRTLGDGKPKYLNTPETPLFRKSSILFNFYRAKKSIRSSGQVILMEGHMDVITAYQAGIENVIASQGTSFTEEMARFLRRYVEQVTLCYDGDEAGQDSTSRAATILEEHGLSVRVALLRDGKDPDEYIRLYGGDRFRVEILKSSVPFITFRLDRLKRGLNLQDPQIRSKYVEKALAEISMLSSAIEREEYLNALGNEFQIPLQVLRKELEKIVRKNLRDEKRRDMSVNKWNNKMDISISSSEKRLKPAFVNAERKLLGLMIKHPEIIPRVMNDLGGAFNEEAHVVIAAEIYAGYLDGEKYLPTAILHRLGNPELQSRLTEIIMEEMDEPISDKGLSDLIEVIKEVPKQRELNVMMKERAIALETGDLSKARSLDIQIRERQKKMKRILLRR